MPQCRQGGIQVLPRCLQERLPFVIERVANALLLRRHLRQRVLRRGVQAVDLGAFHL